MIIVTGGAGFIGSNIVAALEERATHKIVVCDIFDRSTKWKNLAQRELYDCLHPSQLFSYLEAHKTQISCIIHMGANSDTTERNVDLILEQNYRSTLSLLHWCGEEGVRFIYASSAATYGDGSAGFVDDFTRKALGKLRPLNPYGWSKHLLDRTLAQMHEQKSSKGQLLPPQYVGLKFFNVYGPNEYHKDGQMSVAYQVFQQIQQTGKARLFRSSHKDYADGGQLRDFVYVKDCVDVVMWFYDHSEISGLFNVGTGKARSFADLARAVFSALEKEEILEYVDMPDILKGCYQNFTQASTGNLRAAGYKAPFHSLEDGVKGYVQEFLNKSDPYR